MSSEERVLEPTAIIPPLKGLKIHRSALNLINEVTGWEFPQQPESDYVDSLRYVLTGLAALP